MIPKSLLNFLIVCFWSSIVLFVIEFFLPFCGAWCESNVFLQGVSIVQGSLLLFLFIYSLYFYYKYDRYSKAGIYFILFHLLYTLIYFYRIIWKRKRELVNSFESEPVLGNTIFLETEQIIGVRTQYVLV